MGFRFSSRSVRHRGKSRWPVVLSWMIIGGATVLFAWLAVRNARRHDALVQWRTRLEVATGSPAWPSWVAAWPSLPVPRRQHQMRTDLRGPYAYAATHAEDLAHIPCYCGCVEEGHRSNLHCYVTAFRQDGSPVWTEHAFTCDICVHITREVMLMSSHGMRLVDVRGVIDQRYRHGTHRPTNTPVPEPAKGAR